MKQNTMIAIFAILLIAGAFYFGVVQFNPANITGQNPTATPVAGIPAGTGNLAIALNWFDHGNNDAATATNASSVKVYHMDGSLFGATSVGATISGQMKASDNGHLYMVVTPVSTAYILKDVVSAQNQPYIGSATPVVVSGVTVYQFPIDVSSLTYASGQTTTVTLNMFETIADVSGLVYNSVVNGTSADFSGTTYVTTSATGYIGGLTQKDGFKIVKVELSMPNAGNISYYDGGQFKNVQVILGLGNGQSNLVVSSWSHFTGGTYLEANLGVVDVSQEYYGIPVVYGISNSANDISYTVNAQCANFGASAVFLPSLIISYVGPDGTPGTFTRVISFTDS